jgi:tripartite-type tricarboxylate transporter receptor subunit TctC
MIMKGMTMIKRRDLVALGVTALSALALNPRGALAQPRYPDRPIRLVIPFPPGGVNDAIGRPWADKMKSLLGTVVVENIGGAGGALGALAVARAQPDGYTLLLGSGGTQVIIPVASSQPQYDPVKAFETIAIVGVTAVCIAVHPSLPVRTLTELVDYAKANPGKLSYGSAGSGTMTHLTGELFKSLTGTAGIVHVPYRGAGPAITDAVSGHIPMITPNVTGQVLELHKSGRLRILAVTTPARVMAAPDIPTAVEAGLPDMIAQNFVGLFAPAQTPRPIIDRIVQATRAGLAERDLQQVFLAAAFEPQVDSGPESARRFLDDEIARWSPIIKAIGLKLD